MEKITINNYKSAFVAEEFVIKSGSWIIHLGDVEFMTYRINEKDENSYLVVMHIGDKEAKIMVDDISAVYELFTAWAKTKGKELNLELEDLKGEVIKWD